MRLPSPAWMCYFSGGREVGQCCSKWSTWRVPGRVCRLCNHSAAALWCGEHQLPLVFSVTLLGKLCMSFWAVLCLSEWWLSAIKKDPSSVCYAAGIQQKGHKKLLKHLPWSMLEPQPFPVVERYNTAWLCTESSLESEALWTLKLSFQATYVSSKAL